MREVRIAGQQISATELRAGLDDRVGRAELVLPVHICCHRCDRSVEWYHDTLLGVRDDLVRALLVKFA